MLREILPVTKYTIIKNMWFIFIFLVNVQLVRSACEQSYLAKCDSLEDLLKEDLTKLGEVRNLVIEPKDPNFIPRYNLTWKYLTRLYGLESLVIVQQVIEINKEFLQQFLFSNYLIKNLVFYKNNIRVLEENDFSATTDSIVSFRLDLVNNNIEDIQSGAFHSYGRITTIDLSHNKLTVLYNGTFSYSGAEQVIIRHNNLINIEKDAFNTNLKVLKLDYNNIYYLSSAQLTNLNNLIVLTASHNKLSQLSDFSSLTSLQVLDVSYNNLHFVGSELNNSISLKWMDFSNNLLESFSFPRFLVKNFTRETVVVLLSNNRLRKLDPKDLKLSASLSMYLSGNPWNCNCFKELEKFVATFRYGGVSISDIDVIRSGKIPYCVVKKSYDEKCSDTQISTEKFMFFRNMTRRVEQTCNIYLHDQNIFMTHICNKFK